MTDLATTFIADREGFVSTPYRDQGGVWTIGYGFTYLPNGTRVCATTPAMTRDDAYAHLTTLVGQVEKSVANMVHVPVTAHQLAALTSFAYNLGTYALRTSTLLELLNKGDYAGAAAQFPVWVYVNGETNQGLVNRRRLEAALFTTPDETQGGPAVITGLPRVAPSAPVAGSGQTADDLNAAELNRVENT